VPLSDNARAALLGVVAAAGAFFVFHGSGGGGTSSDPLDAVPKGSFVAATIDAQDLRRSPVWTALFGDTSASRWNESAASRALGIGGLAAACGFDPLSRVSRLAIAIPEEGDRGEFGVAAKIDVTRDEIEKCTTSLAAKHGGGKTHDVGSFTVLESGAGSSQPRLAYGGGGLLVVSKGPWLDAMLASAERQAPGVRESAEHAALRKAIASRDGWKSPTAIVTAILPSSLRARLKKEMGDDAGGSDEDRKSAETMAGVLGVSSVGIALKLGKPGGDVEADVELACDSADACTVVQKLIQKKRLDWSRDLLLRLGGFGPLIDSLQVKQDGAHLRATASADADGLASAIGRLLERRTRTTVSTEPSLVKPAPQPAATPRRPPPDELMTAPKPSPDAGP
jgi:hypothetical protein